MVEKKLRLKLLHRILKNDVDIDSHNSDRQDSQLYKMVDADTAVTFELKTSVGQPSAFRNQTKLKRSVSNNSTCTALQVLLKESRRSHLLDLLENPNYKGRLDTSTLLPGFRPCTIVAPNNRRRSYSAVVSQKGEPVVRTKQEKTVESFHQGVTNFAYHSTMDDDICTAQDTDTEVLSETITIQSPVTLQATSTMRSSLSSSTETLVQFKTIDRPGYSKIRSIKNLRHSMQQQQQKRRLSDGNDDNDLMVKTRKQLLQQSQSRKSVKSSGAKSTDASELRALLRLSGRGMRGLGQSLSNSSGLCLGRRGSVGAGSGIPATITLLNKQADRSTRSLEINESSHTYYRVRRMDSISSGDGVGSHSHQQRSVRRATTKNNSKINTSDAGGGGGSDGRDQQRQRSVRRISMNDSSMSDCSGLKNQHRRSIQGCQSMMQKQRSMACLSSRKAFSLMIQNANLESSRDLAANSSAMEESNNENASDMCERRRDRKSTTATSSNRRSLLRRQTSTPVHPSYSNNITISPSCRMVSATHLKG